MFKYYFNVLVAKKLFSVRYVSLREQGDKVGYKTIPVRGNNALKARRGSNHPLVRDFFSLGSEAREDPKQNYKIKHWSTKNFGIRDQEEEFTPSENILESRQRKLSIPKHLVSTRLWKNSNNTCKGAEGRVGLESEALKDFFLHSKLVKKVERENPKLAARLGWTSSETFSAGDDSNSIDGLKLLLPSRYTG